MTFYNGSREVMGDTLTVVFTGAKEDGHKTESQVTECTGEVGSPNCAQKESGSRVSRPQCPSVCHQFTRREARREEQRTGAVTEENEDSLKDSSPTCDHEVIKNHQEHNHSWHGSGMCLCCVCLSVMCVCTCVVVVGRGGVVSLFYLSLLSTVCLHLLSHMCKNRPQHMYMWSRVVCE